MFRNLFKNSQITKSSILGPLVFVDDGADTYWEATDYSDFALAAVYGNEAGPFSKSIVAFNELISEPTKLFSLLDTDFIDKARPEHVDLLPDNISTHFRLHSLTVNTVENFEFGLHSNTHDIFIELFVRKGKVSEIHKDTGCCD